MLQHIAPKSTTEAQAIALPFDGEEVLSSGNTRQANHTALYALAVAIRIGLVAAILLRLLAVWQW